jgi:hypothetical protein
MRIPKAVWIAGAVASFAVAVLAGWASIANGFFAAGRSADASYYAGYAGTWARIAAGATAVLVVSVVGIMRHRRRSATSASRSDRVR